MSKHSKDECSSQAKRARTSKTVFRCYDCEQVYQPIRKGHKFCTKCSEDRPIRPINAVAVDHSYPGNKKCQSSPSLEKPSVIDGWKLEPIKLVPKNQPSIVSLVPNSSSLIDHTVKNSHSAMQQVNLQNKTPKQTLTGIKDKEVAVVKVKENISSSSSTLESETTATKNCATRRSSTATGTSRKSTDGIPLAVIDLSTSSCEESNNDDDEKQVICMENSISSQKASFKNEADDSCPSESHQIAEQCSKTGLPSKSSDSSKKSTELIGNPEHLPIRNVQQPALSNHMLDFSTLELDDLKVKQEKLKEMLILYELDFDGISSIQKRITELESRHSAEKEIIIDKEGVVKSFELKFLQSQYVLEAFAEERDSLCIHLKEASAAVELARSSSDSTEMGVNEIKRKLEESKDEVVKNYLLTILAKKEERAKDAEAKVKYTVSQLEEADKDLKKTEEDLKSKEAVHHEMLLQGEKLKSELMALRDTCNSTDEEIQRAHSQLKSLRQGNNLESLCKYFELKKQLLEIQCKIECSEYEKKLEKERKEFQQSLEIKLVLKKKELDAERESRSQMLSLTP